MSVTDADLALNAAADWIGPVRAGRLLAAFGSAEAALAVEPRDFAAAAGRMAESVAVEVLAFCRAFDARAERAAAEAAGVRIFKLGEPGYPALLGALAAPPRLVYARGSLPAHGETCVAVVGTRRPSAYGLRMAASIAAGLARAGVWVVSGLALGIDAAAHEACLEAGGRTLAVQGRGLADIYPKRHRVLGERISGQGALLSQFAMFTEPHPKRFPQRNALISGLCRGVVVVEGERDSGSLITADFALEQGREVFAVPGRADDPMAQGPLQLLDQGAKLVRSAEDVLQTLGLADAAARPARGVPSVEADAGLGLDPSSPAGRLWASLPGGPVGLEVLSRSSGLAPAALAAAVTELELLGLLRQLPGPRFERVQA